MPFTYTFPFLFDEYTPTLTESVELADSIIKYFQFGGQAFAETLTLSDSIAAQIIITKIFSEEIQLSDIIWAKILKELTENTDLSDSLTKYVIMAALTENPQLGDTITLKALKEFAESAVLSDLVIKKMFTEFTEQTILQDVIDKMIMTVLTDGVSLTDLALDLKTMKNLAEEIDLLDSILKKSFYEFEEGVILADSIVPTIARILVETLIIAEVMGKLIGKNLTERIELDDLILISSIISVTIDLLNKAHTIGRTDVEYVIELAEKESTLTEIEREAVISLLLKMKTLEIMAKEDIIEEISRAISSQRSTSGSRVITYDKDKSIEELEKEDDIEFEEKERTVTLTLKSERK